MAAPNQALPGNGDGTRPRVFISYSHKDEAWKDRLKPQLKALEMAGRLIVWDDRDIDAGEKWYPEIEAAMASASAAVCLISAHYLSSPFCVKEEVPYLLERREKEGMLLIPVLISPCPWTAFPWISQTQMLPRDGKSVLVDYKDTWDDIFLKVAERIDGKFSGKALSQAALEPAYPAPGKVDISRMPATGAELFGRVKEMAMLDKTWASDDTRVVSLVAWGGVGKTTLVNKWLERMEKDNFRGASHVYAWSFYSQGTGERVTSADQFISAALAWFGDPDPQAGSAWDKGTRLARLVGASKTLLILDGMEPLQSGEDYEKGKIKDPALAMLVRGLARENTGLCLITTRQTVAELNNASTRVIQQDLEQISPQAGRALLNIRGIRGTDEQKEALSRDLGNQALAVNLAAQYLYQFKGHRIDHADNIPDLDIPEEKGRHPRRVLQALADHLGEGPELEILRFLGLFDRPVPMAALGAVLAGEPLEGLTNHLHSLTEMERLQVLKNLRDLNLVAKESVHRGSELDCHPLVREHFGEILENDFHQSWKAANKRLYQYYKNLPEKELPDTLVEMEPLFRAVIHGCRAGLHQEVHDSIYFNRIRRKNEYYIWNQLGAIGSWLAIISAFFDIPWQTVSPDLEENDQAVLLNNAAIGLKSLGRLREVVSLLENGLAIHMEQEDWKNAAIDSSNISQLRLTLGEVKQAVEAGRQCVEFADESKDEFQSIAKRTVLACALLKAGHIEVAADFFQEAEAMQQKQKPDFPFLYSVRGFHYCNLLLERREYKSVLDRAETALKISKGNNSLLAIALDHLSLGRARLLQVLAIAKEQGREPDRNTPGISTAHQHRGQAVDGLRESGRLDELPRGLLTRANLFRTMKAYESAWQDLGEVKEISESGEMRLFLTDYHLEAARLILAQHKENIKDPSHDSAKTFHRHVETAETLINETGYHRRDKELADLRAAVETGQV